MTTPRGDLLQQAVGNLTNGSDSSALRHVKRPSVVLRQKWSTPMGKSTRINPVPLQDADKRLNEDILDYAYKRNPHAPVKELEAAAGCTYRTAESWWGRKTSPGKKHLLRLMRSWGRDFIAVVLSSVDEDLAAMARLEAETEKLRRDHQRLLEAYEQAFSKE